VQQVSNNKRLHSFRNDGTTEVYDKELLKKWVFERFLKTVSDGANVTLCVELCAAAAAEYFADAAAADRNWSARRRRGRPNVGVAPVPSSWRLHVMLYTSYMLLDFC